MVDESVLRDLLDGKISPEEVDDPNIVSPVSYTHLTLPTKA